MIRKQTFVDPVGGDEMTLPVTPSGYQWTVGNEIVVTSLDNVGVVHLAGLPTLNSESIEGFFPAQGYHFNTAGASTTPQDYIDWFTAHAQAGTVLRYLVSGTSLNEAVIIEAFKYWEEDGTNDVYYKLSLRGYVAPDPVSEVDAVDTTVRTTETLTTASVYHTVVSGDNLWTLCRTYYGTTSMELCQRVASHNGIANANLIYVGQVIEFPPLEDLTTDTVAATTASAGSTTLVTVWVRLATQTATDDKLEVTSDDFGYATIAYTDGSGNAVQDTLRNGSQTEFSYSVPSGNQVVVSATNAGGYLLRGMGLAGEVVSTMKTTFRPTQNKEVILYWGPTT